MSGHVIISMIDVAVLVWYCEYDRLLGYLSSKADLKDKPDLTSIVNFPGILFYGSDRYKFSKHWPHSWVIYNRSGAAKKYLEQNIM